MTQPQADQTMDGSAPHVNGVKLQPGLAPGAAGAADPQLAESILKMRARLCMPPVPDYRMELCQDILRLRDKEALKRWAGGCEVGKAGARATTL